MYMYIYTLFLDRNSFACMSSIISSLDPLAVYTCTCTCIVAECISVRLNELVFLAYIYAHTYVTLRECEVVYGKTFSRYFVHPVYVG